MAKAFAMIMAGGGSPSLSVLTEVRADAAVTFAGKYRLIDFPLSNCVNSDIYNVAVLTQYRPQSLMSHIGTGTPWDLDLNSGGVRILHPYKGGPDGDWQKGTADAVRRNLDFVKEQSEENVLILCGDHIYLMDYRDLLRQHEQSGADITLAVRRVNQHQTHRYGIVSMGTDQRIYDFEEKSRRARGNLASMGIYVFRKKVLIKLLEEHNFIDFGRDVLPYAVTQSLKVMGYNFPGYWEDVGDIQAYWESNMGLLSEDPALDLYDPNWVVHTRSFDRASVRIGAEAQVSDNILSNGCQVEGTVSHSVLSPGVYVAPGAVVRDSILLSNVRVEAGCVLNQVIVDHSTVIGAGTSIGSGDDVTPNSENPTLLNTGLSLVGMECTIAGGLTIGRNVLIHNRTKVTEGMAKKKAIVSGSTLGKYDK